MASKKQLIDIDMNGNIIVGLADGTSANHAVNLGQLDAKLTKSGDTIDGVIDGGDVGSLLHMAQVSTAILQSSAGGGVPITVGDGFDLGGTYDIIGVNEIEVATISSGSAALILNNDVDMNGAKIENLADPTTAQGAATKAYVDANAGGSLSSRYETVDNQTASFTDDIVYLDGIATIYLPHNTTGYTGKRIQFTTLNNPVNIVEVINPSPLSTSTTTLFKQLDSITLEAQAYNALSNNWRVVERIEATTDRIAEYDSTVSTLYVPYTGGSGEIDFSGGSIKTVSIFGPDDTGIGVGAGTNVTPDTNGGDASLGGGMALGNANGGRAVVVAGNADTSGGYDGNGGNVYIQTGQAAGSGTPGLIELRQGGKFEYATISIDSLTANQTYNLPNMSGNLLAGDGTNGITVGTTAPSAPVTGDLWVDTN